MLSESVINISEKYANRIKKSKKQEHSRPLVSNQSALDWKARITTTSVAPRGVKEKALGLAIPMLRRELRRVVKNFNQSIKGHHHMKAHIDIGHLSKYDVFKRDRGQVMDLQTCSILILILSQRPQKPYKLLAFFMISVIL